MHVEPKMGGEKTAPQLVVGAAKRFAFIATSFRHFRGGCWIYLCRNRYANSAAALGVVAAMLLAFANGKLSLGMMRQAAEGTMRTTAMIMLIIIAAVFLNFVLSIIGLTQALTDFVTGLGWTPMQTMLMIVAVLVIIGCFMETLSMLLTMAPLITPIVVALGFDPVWFGILLMVLLETALITPPIGINLYVVQGIRQGGPMNDVIKGALPFVITMFVMLGLLLVFPGLALWLPSLVY